jgi:hypothetical protein
MSDEFDDDDVAKIPTGVLPEIKRQLVENIKKNPVEAWKFLDNELIANVALSGILQELQMEIITENEDSAGSFLKEDEINNINQFLDDYEKKFSNMFSIKPIIDRHGYAFTIELIAEYWRRNNQLIQKSTINSLLLSCITEIWGEVSKLDNNQDSRVLREMVIDLNTRILSLSDYEKDSFTKHWNNMSNPLSKFIQEMLDSEQSSSSVDLPDNWQSLLMLTNLSSDSLSEFQKNFSILVYNQIQEKFDSLSEDQKFKLAPWILQLKKNMNA